MTPKQRIRHEFLLLQSKLGEDAVMFLHLDECPKLLDDAFNISYACNTWCGITDEELVQATVTGELKALAYESTLHALTTGKDVIDDLILELEKEKPDGETST